MRRSRVLTISTTVLAAVIVLFASTTDAWADSANGYVALGDSYASGVGSGDYIASSGSCDRSPHAYPALWASAHPAMSSVSVACSGATTASVTSTQLTALSTNTSLVSVTIGGNDVGFSTILTDCDLHGTSTCVREVSAAEAQAQSVLPGRLDELFSAISQRAPQARVVATGYPLFYDLSKWLCLGLSSHSRSKIDEGIGILDGLIQQAAAAHGFAFADVRSSFSGHEICDGGSYLHSVDLLDLSSSYHPTATGQSRGYYPAFASAAG